MVGKKHVSSACLNCRRRKVRCDGNETCAHCLAANVPCEYNAEADMRKISAKKVISELRARVDQLETALRQNGLQQHVQQAGEDCQNILSLYDSRPAPRDTSDRDSSGVSPIAKPAPPTDAADVPEAPTATAATAATTAGSPPRPSATGETQTQTQTQRRHPAPSTPDTTTTANHSGSQAGPSPSSHSLFDLVADNRGGKTDGDPQIISAHRNSFSSSGKGYSPSFANDFVSKSTRDFFKSTGVGAATAPSPASNAGAGHDGTDAESIEEMLSARMGTLRLAEDGQMRYYGPTSNLHVQTGGSHFLSQSKIRQVATEGAGVLRGLGLDRDVALSMELHLAKLYFTWEDPNVHAVDEEIYFQEKQRWTDGNRTTNYYSETLNNAICAIGASLAVDEDLGFTDVRASEFFSARAKALLDIEMDSPTIATVQALVVMSASEAALTRDARGWLYSGMAARLSADLGLHMDVTNHKDRGLLTERDMRIRSTTFWGVFIHEVMWSLYVGRPSGLGVRTISVERPDISLDEAKAKLWVPYPRNSAPSVVPAEGLFFPAEAITDATITQCEFMAKINTTLYSGRILQINDLVGFLIQTKAALYEWREHLPASLKVDLSDPSRAYIPSILQIHMQFYALLITLYRPYLSTSLMHQNRDEISAESVAALRRVPADCIEAARRTTEYLRCYQRQHTMARSNIQMVHIVFTTAVILIYDICGRSTDQAWVSQRDLQFCSDLLSQLGRCFGNANRAHEVTVLTKHQWWNVKTDRKARSAAAKRDSGNMSGGGSWGDDVGGDTADRRRRRYSPPASDTAPQPFTAATLLNTFEPFEPYIEPVPFTAGFGVVEDTVYDNDNHLFMDDAELYMNNMAGQMEWFDPSQLYTADGPANKDGAS